MLKAEGQKHFELSNGDVGKLPQNGPSSLLAQTCVRIVPYKMFFDNQVLYGAWQVLYPASYDVFQAYVRQICRLQPDDPMVIKWLDREKDFCTIGGQRELSEMVRLNRCAHSAHHNHQSMANLKQSYEKVTDCITIKVCRGKFKEPGDLCEQELGEQKASGFSQYQRRQRKIFVIGNHHFHTSRFTNRNATCDVCHKRVWPIGFYWYHCVLCNLKVHKKCHRFVTGSCKVDAKVSPNVQSDGLVAAHPKKQTESDEKPPDVIWSFRQTLYQAHQGSKEAKSNGVATCSIDGLSTNNQNITDTEDDDLRNSTLSINSLKQRRFTIPPKHHESYCSRVSYGSSRDSINSNVVFYSQTNLGTPEVDYPRSCLNSLRSVPIFDFHVLNLIGRGSYAKVFKVKEKPSGQIYAMKVIKKSVLCNSDGDYEWVLTERHVFDKVKGHPFLISLYCSFQTDNHVFFLSQFIDGGDLMFHMQKLKRLSEEHARFYTAEISSALYFLHCKGIIYRDLKLDNILIDVNGNVKLTDYGMCKENLPIGGKTTTFCGTPNYIAPEILSGAPYGVSVDIWALGVLTFEMLVGKSPFSNGYSAEAVCDADRGTEDLLFQLILEQPIRIPRFLSHRAASLLLGLLEKDPAHRLGCNPSDNPHIAFRELTSHPFFRNIDFQRLIELAIKPPYVPGVSPGGSDVSCFDKQFTSAPIQLTPENSIRRKNRHAYSILTAELLRDFPYFKGSSQDSSCDQKPDKTVVVSKSICQQSGMVVYM